MRIDQNEVLSSLWSLVQALRGTSSLSLKTDLIVQACKRTDGLAGVLWQLYNPFRMYNLTSDSCEGVLGVPESTPIMDVFGALDALHRRRVTGMKAKAVWVRTLSDLQPELQEAAKWLLDKDLKAGVGVSTFNKAMVVMDRHPVPIFSVARGIQQKKAKPFNWEEGWYASRKLDGVRCVALFDDGRVSLLSREGRPFHNFDVIATDVINLSETLPHRLTGEGFVLDGELALTNSTGQDDFHGLMKVLRSNDGQVENVRLNVFDLLSLEAFSSGKTSQKWSDRQRTLRDNIPPRMYKHLRVVQQIRIEDDTHMKKLLDSALGNGWEGLILRKNTAYIGKRSNDIVKLKKLFDIEAEVVRVISGTISFTEDGKVKEETAMTAAVIEYKGNQVRVGSGWTLQQRRDFFKKPADIIGQIITVEFMEESVNSKTGAKSLRHPVVKFIHGEERTL